MNNLESGQTSTDPLRYLADTCQKQSKSAKNSETAFFHAMKTAIKMMSIVCKTGAGFDQMTAN